MSLRAFTLEEMEELGQNPNVKNVGRRGITYTKKFKEYFIVEKENGKLTTEIFKEAGFNTKLIGRHRMDGFCRRVMQKGINNLDDCRKGHSGRQKKIYCKPDCN